MMQAPLVKIEKENDVSIIILNRPSHRNAINDELIRSFIAICEEVSEDTTIRAIVVSSACQDFSVGADIDQVKAASTPNLLEARRRAELGTRLLRTLRELPQPTICALQGVTIGGGACIAVGCDFRIAERGARLGFREVRMAMNLMWGALPMVVELVGPARAKRMLMSGELFDVDVLTQWGLMDRVCDSDTLASNSMQWARELSSLPPAAVQMIKRSINRYSLALAESVSHMDSDQWLLATKTDDFSEAIDAFLEKRVAKFVGG